MSGALSVAARQRVGRLRLPAVRHPLGHGRGERVVGGLADRLEHVDVIEGRIDARRGADRRRVDRPAVGQRRAGRDQVDVHQHRQVAADRVDVADRDRRCRCSSARSICTLVSQADCVVKSGSTAVMLWRGRTKPGGHVARLVGNAGAPAPVPGDRHGVARADRRCSGSRCRRSRAAAARTSGRSRRAAPCVARSSSDHEKPARGAEVVLVDGEVLRVRVGRERPRRRHVEQVVAQAVEQLHPRRHLPVVLHEEPVERRVVAGRQVAEVLLQRGVAERRRAAPAPPDRRRSSGRCRGSARRGRGRRR